MSDPLPRLPDHELRPFLHGIQADPEDDLAIRALGDWLEEIGDVRADLVRAGLYGDLNGVKRWRERYGEAWWGGLPEGVSLEVRRGLIEVECEPGQLCIARPRFPDRLLEMMSQGWVYRVVFRNVFRHFFEPWPEEVMHNVTALSWGETYALQVDRLPHLPRLRELDFSKSRLFGDKAIPYLDRFPGLWRLYLSGCEALKEAAIAGFAELRHLRMGWNPNLVGLTLRDLPELRVLSLAMNDRFRTLRAGELPSLRELSLRGCLALTDGGMAPLAGMAALEVLDMDHCALVQGAGLAHLAGLPNLRELTLSGCAALRRVRLSQMPALQTLDLGQSGVEELELADLPALEKIDLFGANALRAVTLTELPKLARAPLADRRELRRVAIENLPLLRSLDLSGLRRLTDLRLASVEGLKRLDLRKSGIRPTAVKEHRARLPNCEVMG